MSSDFILAGDIGGTKTHLTIFTRESGALSPVADVRYPSAQFNSLDDVIEKFLAKSKLTADSAVFAVAGPVICGKAKITNLPWLVDCDEIRRKFAFSTVRVINDIVGIAASVLILSDSDLHTINKGKQCEKGSIAVVAPGTGLGVAHLVWNGKKYVPHPSEGGHSGFAPANRFQSGLLRYLQAKYGTACCENVCSGPGIRNIYEYLKRIDYATDSEKISSEIASAGDPSPVITQAALKGDGANLCVATIDTFVSILGAIAGNIALNFLATGGVYLGGGIPKIIIPFLEKPEFMSSFIGRSPMSSLLSQISVKVITHRSPALVGSANLLIQT